VIRRLAPTSQAWTLGEAGTTPLAQFQGPSLAELKSDDENAEVHP
jgi:hypothetical protein